MSDLHRIIHRWHRTLNRHRSYWLRRRSFDSSTHLPSLSSSSRITRVCHTATVVSNDKKPPEIKIKNWVKWLIILMHSTVWKFLEMQLCKSVEICLKKIVKSHCQVNLFLADFSNLKPLCTASYTSALCALHKLNHTLVHTPCMHSTKVVNSIMVFQNGIQKGNFDPLNVFDWVHSLCFIFSQGDLAWQYTVH